jgi:hypothetical protein
VRDSRIEVNQRRSISVALETSRDRASDSPDATLDLRVDPSVALMRTFEHTGALKIDTEVTVLG